MRAVRRPYAWFPGWQPHVWCVLLLLGGVTPLLARPVEPVAYATLQRSVAAAMHVQTISEAGAFLRQFPHSVERQQVSFWLAEALYATQAYQDAVLVYRELLREAPTFPQAASALRHLGLSYLYARHDNAALATFARLLEQYPGVEDREQVVLDMATLYFGQGRFEAALLLYQQLQQVDRLPLSEAALHLQLGHCYLYMRQFASALEQYRFVLEHFPTSKEALLAQYQLGTAALAQQQFDVARQHFQTMLNTYASELATRRAHYGMVWSFFHQGQPERAATYLKERYLLVQPSASDTTLAQGYELLLLRAYEEAIPLFTEALTQVHPEEQEQRLRWLLAQAYEGAGAILQALEVLDDFVRRFPRSARTAIVQRWRGDLWLRWRDTAEALVAYRAALPLLREDEPAEQLLLRIAELYQAQNASADALVTWERLLQIYPLTPRRIEVQLRIGASLVQQGAMAQAVALYRDLLTTDDLPRSAHVQARLQLAWAYLKGSDYDRAQALYGELVQTTQDVDVLRQAHFWRGWVLQRQEQYETSNAEWQALLALEPPGPRRGEVLWRLGRNFMALKQFRQARDRFHDVVTTYALEPYAHLAAWQLQWCLLELQQYREALQSVSTIGYQDPLAFFNVAEHFARGERLFDAKQYRPARQVFQQIVAQPFMTPLADDAAFMIAESYFVTGDARRALQHYRVVTQQYGQTNVTALGFYRQGLILEAAERFAAAVPVLYEAAEQATDPDIRERAWYHLGKAYVQLQQADEALVVFRRLVQEGKAAFGTEAERLYLGLMLQQLADYAMALQVFRQVAQQSPEPRLQAEAQFWIAETYQLQGEAQAALTAYRDVASRFPDQPKWALTALFRAGEISEALHQYQDAIGLYQHVATANPHDLQGRLAAERVKYLRTKMAEIAAQQR